jgi:hypothetical protein
MAPPTGLSRLSRTVPDTEPTVWPNASDEKIISVNISKTVFFILNSPFVFNSVCLIPISKYLHRNNSAYCLSKTYTAPVIPSPCRLRPYSSTNSGYMGMT